MSMYEVGRVVEEAIQTAAMLASMSWVLVLIAILGAYVFTGYMYMCIGKKAGIEEDWKPFIPIARQLYMMKIAERPWWNILLFADSGTIVFVLSSLSSWIIVKLTKSITLAVVLVGAYLITVMVFTFLYYRSFFTKFRFNPNVAWLEMIPGLSYIAMVFQMLIAFSDVIVTNNGYTEDINNNVIPREPAVIKGLTGEYAGFSFDISDGAEVVLGRDATVSQIVFNQFQAKVSRLHCKIRYDAQTNNYYVTDYSTTSGTYLENGNRFEEGVAKLVARGTVIYLGDKTNSFRLQ